MRGPNIHSEQHVEREMPESGMDEHVSRTIVHQAAGKFAGSKASTLETGFSPERASAGGNTRRHSPLSAIERMASFGLRRRIETACRK